MNDSAMLSPTNQKLLHYITEYLPEKFSIEENVPFIASALETDIPHFNKVISIFNRERKNDFESDFPWLWCVNAQEANALMQKALPTMIETFDLLTRNSTLAVKIFENLRENTYLVNIWKLTGRALAHNVMLLIYRTTILFQNESKYFNKFTKRPAIQLSSTIEEMIFCLKITTGESPLFESFEHWLKNWKEEGLTEELYKATLVSNS